MMTAIATAIETHHKLVITALGLVIVLMVVSCVFDDLIPICHLVFGCDHGMHATMTR